MSTNARILLVEDEEHLARGLAFNLEADGYRVEAVERGEARDMPVTDGDLITVPAASSKVVPYGLWGFAKEMIHIGGTIPLF